MNDGRMLFNTETAITYELKYEINSKESKLVKLSKFKTKLMQ